jgi:hypothetical protein
MVCSMFFVLLFCMSHSHHVRYCMQHDGMHRRRSLGALVLPPPRVRTF